VLKVRDVIGKEKLKCPKCSSTERRTKVTLCSNYTELFRHIVDQNFDYWFRLKAKVPGLEDTYDLVDSNRKEKVRNNLSMVNRYSESYIVYECVLYAYAELCNIKWSNTGKCFVLRPPFEFNYKLPKPVEEDLASIHSDQEELYEENSVQFVGYGYDASRDHPEDVELIGYFVNEDTSRLINIIWYSVFFANYRRLRC